LSQSLVDEIIRFALIKNDEWRMRLLRMVDALGEEEAAFQICWRTYQWPTRTPEKSLEEFAEKVSLERLLIIAQKHGIGDVVETVVGVAKTIPRFNPHGGFAVFGKFIGELVRIAEASGGSLVNYFNKFTSVKDLENEFKKLPGMGPILARGLVRELRLADIIKLDVKDLDLAPSDPVMNVLKRISLIPKDASPEDAENAVRKMLKEPPIVPPILLDAGVWHIGFYYCRKKPECDICPITHVCPKHIDCGNEET